MVNGSSATVRHDDPVSNVRRRSGETPSGDHGDVDEDRRPRRSGRGRETRPVPSIRHRSSPTHVIMSRTSAEYRSSIVRTTSYSNVKSRPPFSTIQRPSPARTARALPRRIRSPGSRSDRAFCPSGPRRPERHPARRDPENRAAHVHDRRDARQRGRGCRAERALPPRGFDIRDTNSPRTRAPLWRRRAHSATSILLRIARVIVVCLPPPGREPAAASGRAALPPLQGIFQRYVRRKRVKEG